MTQVALTEAKDQLASFVKKAVKEDVIITVNGRAVAVLKGFADEEDYFEYCLLNDPRLKARIARSRRQFKDGNFKLLEDLPH